MSEDNTIVIGVKSEPAGNAPTGKFYIWVSSNGHMWTKNDAGTLLDHGATGPTIHNDLTSRDASDAHPISAVTGLTTSLSGLADRVDDIEDELPNKLDNDDFNADGDILIGTGDGTYTALTKPSLTAGEGDYSLVTTDDTGDVEWVKHQSNSVDLNYITASTYTVDYATDHTVVCAGTVAQTISFSEPNDYFTATGRGKLFFINNATADQTVTVQLDSTSTFQNGMNQVILYPRDQLHMGVVKANVADGYYLLQRVYVDLQVRLDTPWASGNFNATTAIPYDTNDHIHDANSLDHSETVNNSRINLKIKGEYNVTFWLGINSTGGGSWSLTGYLRKNGTTIIDGSQFATANYNNEDSHCSVGPIQVDATSSTDYFEILVNQNNLTGYVQDAVIRVEANL